LQLFLTKCITIIEEAKKKAAEQRPRANTVADPTPSPKKGAVAAAAKKGIANTPGIYFCPNLS
jgi:hypothetical protein